MKRFYSTIFFLCFINAAFTQQLSQVTYTYATSLAWFSVTTGQNVLIRISDDGKALEWGTEEQSLFSNNYYAPKLLPYMGRVDYYGPEADSAYRGKVKSIGTTTITYYGTGEFAVKTGKIKTIGSLLFDYYTHFDDKLLSGQCARRAAAVGSLRRDDTGRLRQASPAPLSSEASAPICPRPSFCPNPANRPS